MTAIVRNDGRGPPGSGIMAAMPPDAAARAPDADPNTTTTDTSDAEGLESTRALLRGGQLLAIAILLAAVVRGALVSGRTAHWLALPVFAAAALALWRITVLVKQRLLLGGRLRAEIARGNAAAGLAAAVNEVALAIIIARAVYGDSPAQLPSALVFAVLAIGTWAIFVALFRMVTTYADGAEIAGQNLAAALSYSGAALALAVIIGHAVDGPFTGWATSLRAYLLALMGSLALYPVRQLIVGALLLRHRPCLRGGELDRAIAQRQSVGVAAVEAATYLATAFLVAAA
jgi:uncharacterized membrane protein YjfL (UPF0719 family)